MKVFVVTRGKGINYHICGVADTMEKAQILVKYFGHDSNEPANIETYTTDFVEHIESKLPEYERYVSLLKKDSRYRSLLINKGVTGNGKTIWVQ